MTNQAKGRPQGNPSRPRRSVADIVSRTLAAEAMLPDLSDQFGALAPGAQVRVFGVIDQVGGMSHAEKLETQMWLHAVREMEGVSVEFVDLLNAVARLVFYIDHLAEPQAGSSVAERFLAAWAEQNEEG